ncbi:hypothetical protein MJ588_09735 [Klebsiella pneumoniae]|nr:hypothetical protein MJ588_09735 [Klebsiella pneumoniae]
MSNDFLDACVQVIRCGFGACRRLTTMKSSSRNSLSWALSRRTPTITRLSAVLKTAVGGKWGYRCTGMSFINFGCAVMLATLEGGRDATSGQVFLPQEHALSKGNFANFDQVLADWDRQIRYYTRKSIEIEYVVDNISWKRTSTILSARRWSMIASNGRKALSKAARSMTGLPARRWVSSPTPATASRR